MRIDITLEIDDAGRTFVGAGDDWFYVYSDEVKDFLAWVMNNVGSE